MKLTNRITNRQAGQGIGVAQGNNFPDDRCRERVGCHRRCSRQYDIQGSILTVVNVDKESRLVILIIWIRR